MKTKQYFVYILTNPTHSVLYTGVTNNLERRIYEHKEKLVEGFTKKYNCHILLYYEETTDVYEAITREKQIKKYPRLWKANLIKQINPERKDLSLEWA